MIKRRSAQQHIEREVFGDLNPGCCSHIGSIPARAGSPYHASRASNPLEVHPRAGGVTAATERATLRLEGPSPRGRGHPAIPKRRASLTRSIPARAGSPIVAAVADKALGVHPRAGGVTHFLQPSLRWKAGPSPRGGEPGGSIPARAGLPGQALRNAGEPWGPSPRGRGHPHPIGQFLARRGSIPARAGSPNCATAVPVDGGVHPRAGGVTAD